MSFQLNLTQNKLLTITILQILSIFKKHYSLKLLLKLTTIKKFTYIPYKTNYIIKFQIYTTHIIYYKHYYPKKYIPININNSLTTNFNLKKNLTLTLISTNLQTNYT